MGSPYQPKLTPSLLHSYSKAALCNADELLVEASLLRDHGHMARAYYLSVSCIEEVGKALLAFDFRHRNLADPAVCKKFKTLTEDHGKKINYAMGIWASSSPDPNEAIKEVLTQILYLESGRELSMYTDLRSNPDRAQSPHEIVRDTKARGCVRLAKNCLGNAHHHVATTIPAKFTSAQNRVLTMRASNFREILSAADFWWYYASRMEAGQRDFAEAVLGYERNHFRTGVPFGAAE